MTNDEFYDDQGPINVFGTLTNAIPKVNITPGSLKE